MKTEEFKSSKLHNKNEDKFWLNILSSVDFINSVITDKDKQVLKHLSKIDVLKYPHNDNYMIEF